MKHTVEKMSPSKVKLVVDVDHDLWKKAQERAFEKVSSKVVVKGFRPGKAPKAMLQALVNPENVYNEALDEVLNPVFAEAITEEKIEPFFRPSVNISKLSPDEVTIEYTIVLAPKATLGTYKGLAAKKNEATVSDDEVKEGINKRLLQSASLVVVDRPAKKGDTVVLDFLGKSEDDKGNLVPFDGGTANNYSLELGSNQFVPGFEDALVGVKAGEKKEVSITFPEHYVKELAGKKAVFECTIHEVKEKQIPELTDEAVKDLAIQDVDTVAKLQDFEKKSILADKTTKAENDYYSALIAAIVSGSKYEIDADIIANEAAALEDNLKKQVEQNGLTFEQYLDITGAKEEDLKKNFSAEAENNIKGFLALNEVAKSEKITVTDDDLKAEAAKRSKDYGMKEEDILRYMKQDEARWKEMVRDQKIKDFILSVSK